MPSEFGQLDNKTKDWRDTTQVQFKYIAQLKTMLIASFHFDTSQNTSNTGSERIAIPYYTSEGTALVYRIVYSSLQPLSPRP